MPSSSTPSKIATVEMIETRRLRLRQWQEDDFSRFAEMSQDPEVMRYFPTTLSHEQSYEAATRFRADIELNGWGIWAVALQANNQFIGLTGLRHQPDRFEFSPCTEIAWRIARPYWQSGYATEAAQAVMNYGFTTLGLPEIVAFAVSDNTASIAVMRKLEMTTDGGTFLHPELDPDDPLAEHVLYRKRIA
jgi:RimJ/RimL family protein N-acetyltransferase